MGSHCHQRHYVCRRAERRDHRQIGGTSGKRPRFSRRCVTYALSLFVLAKPPLWRANAALFKGISLNVLGIWVLGSTIWRVFVTGVPEAFIIRMLGLLALAANVVSVLILMRFRSGDANLEYVWLCSRNDPIGNVAVVLAAIGVFTTGAAWPDLAVAAIMASLFLSSYL
jgi:hypothetical protein